MAEINVQAQWDAMVKAGIPERLRQQLIISPESNDPEQFKSRIAAAAEMAAIGRILGKGREAFDMDGCVEDFIAHGCTVEQFREAAVRAMAEDDEQVWSTPPARTSSAGGDVIAARAAQIDRLRKALRHG